MLVNQKVLPQCSVHILISNLNDIFFIPRFNTMFISNSLVVITTPLANAQTIHEVSLFLLSQGSVTPLK